MRKKKRSRTGISAIALALAACMALAGCSRAVVEATQGAPEPQAQEPGRASA